MPFASHHFWNGYKEPYIFSIQHAFIRKNVKFFTIWLSKMCFYGHVKSVRIAYIYMSSHSLTYITVKLIHCPLFDVVLYIQQMYIVQYIARDTNTPHICVCTNRIRYRIERKNETELILPLYFGFMIIIWLLLLCSFVNGSKWDRKKNAHRNIIRVLDHNSKQTSNGMSECVKPRFFFMKSFFFWQWSTFVFTKKKKKTHTTYDTKEKDG